MKNKHLKTFEEVNTNVPDNNSDDLNIETKEFLKLFAEINTAIPVNLKGYFKQMPNIAPLSNKDYELLINNLNKMSEIIDKKYGKYASRRKDW